MTQNKKNNIIFICIVSALVILTVIFICLGINKAKDLFMPADLGVEYGQEDIDSLDDKLDIEYTVPNDDTADDDTPSNDTSDKNDETDKNNETEKNEDGDNAQIKDPENILNNGTLGEDYTVNYTGFAQRTIILNDREMTALLNERMPLLTFFKSSQIRANADKSVSFTSYCNIRNTVSSLFPTYDVSIPSFVPSEMPFGATITVTVKDNATSGKLISLDAPLLKLLPIKPGQGFTGKIGSFFASTPELYIQDMHVNDEGMFVITGMLPVKAEIIPINN